MERLYDWLFVVPAGTKHESGYMHMAIIGMWKEGKKENFEICSYPDDIHWHIPDSNRGQYQLAHLRTDCLYPQGVMKFWGRGQFKVDWGSSTEITFLPTLSN